MAVLISTPLAPVTFGGHGAGSVWLSFLHMFPLSSRALDAYWHPVDSKQPTPSPVTQSGLYTHSKPMLMGAPLPPVTFGHGAGSVWLSFLHLFPLSSRALDAYWHPVDSKQPTPPPVTQSGLYTHSKAVLISTPLAPVTFGGHGAGSVWLSFLHLFPLSSKALDAYW